MLDACHDLTKLELTVSQTDIIPLTLIAGIFNSMLLDITLYSFPKFYTAEALARLPARCPALRRLTYDGLQISDTILVEIANACRQLEYVRVSAEKGRVLLVGDTGINALITNCSKLKVIDIGNALVCTALCLETILACGLRVTSMTWSSKVGFGPADVETFLALAKLQQLLPLPKVIWTNDETAP